MPREYDIDTVAQLQIQRKYSKSWRQVAEDLRLDESYAPALNAIANERKGQVSRKREEEIRNALGLPPLRRKRQRYYRPCLPPNLTEKQREIIHDIASAYSEMNYANP